MLRAFAGGRVFGELTGSGTPRVLALHGWRRDRADMVRVLVAAPGDGTGEGGDAGDAGDAGEAGHPGGGAGGGQDAGGGSGRAVPLDAIALDLPGHGVSPEPDGPWGAEDYAQAIEPVLDEMASEVVVVGHSFGGRVGAMLAARAPGRVAGLVLAGVPLVAPGGGAPPKRPLRFRLAKAAHTRGLIGERRMERARTRHGSADYRAASGVLRDVLVRVLAETRSGLYMDALAATTCPIELVWGGEDREVPVAVAEAVRASLGERAALTAIAGAGHMLPIEAPGEVRAALQRCLARAAADRGAVDRSAGDR